MTHPRITNNPYADADARDRFAEENKNKTVRCYKCHHLIEEGEEYYQIPTQLDEAIICEYCISSFTKVMV